MEIKAKSNGNAASGLAGPSAKKAKKDNASSTELPTVSLKKLYFERLGSVIAREQAEGCILVRGIETDDANEDDDSNKEYTADQLASLRHIIITKNRNALLKKATKVVTCGQSNNSIMMFDTSSGNEVIMGLPREIAKAMKKKTLAAKFDALFALTFALQKYDCWMNDNEMWGEDGGLDDAIDELASSWREILSHTNKKLGIDSEFTRPAIECLLAQFRDDLDSCDSVETTFNWSPNSSSNDDGNADAKK